MAEANATRRPYSPRGGPCQILGCGGTAYARLLCQTHYDRQRFRGSAHIACAYCGSDLTNIPRARKFCNAAHAAMYRRHGGSRPHEITCKRCGHAFGIDGVGPAGRTKRSDAIMCPDCKRGRANRHGWSVKALVAHTGVMDCGICGDPVDLTLKKPAMMRPSIDHIIPYAHGGSNDIENLQLAHLHCNHVKSDSGWSRGKRVKRI